MRNSKPPAESRRAETTLVLLIVTALGFIVYSQMRSALRRAARAEAVANMRSFKYALDTFAMDNDGAYPNEDTAEFYELPDPQSSNDFFRQFFASGNTNSERIFWIPRSPVCGPKSPDDVTTSRGKLDPAKTLEPGDNHWAYITDRLNVDDPDSPIVLDSYLPGTTDFSRWLWNGKIIVVHIDSTAHFHNLDASGTLLDAAGNPLLAPNHAFWRRSPPDLRQPEPHR